MAQDIEAIYRTIDAYKARLDLERPFEGKVLDMLRDYYRVGLTWSSNALEGNRLTEMETKIVLEDGLTVGGKPLRDTFEALGHARAYDFMFELLHANVITLDHIRTLHRLFYAAIDEDYAGVWRDHRVAVSGSDYVFPLPTQLEFMMNDFVSWMTRVRETMHPVQFAAMVHLEFVSIHPFADGNGRVARLLMNTVLIQAGYMLAVIPPRLRADYLSAIRSDQQDDDEEPFCNLIAEMALQTQKDVMRLLQIELP